MKTLIFTIGLSVLTSLVWSQPFEDYLRERNKKFEEYKQRAEQKHQEYINKRDKEFAEYLKARWEMFELLKGIDPPVQPKPLLPPVFHEETATDSSQIVPSTSEPEESELIPAQIHQIVPREDFYYFRKQTAGINFYGKELNIEYAADFVPSIVYHSNNEEISRFWEYMATSNYGFTIHQLLHQKEILNLNDWGYYLMIKAFTSEITRVHRLSELLSWFILIKSGYQAKIGYNETGFVLLLPVNTDLYGINYYQLEGTRYYAIDSNGESIMSYKQNHPDATKRFEMVVKSTPSLGEKLREKTIVYKHQGNIIPLNIVYNENMISFFSHYPLMDISNYFNSGMSAQTKESLSASLMPYLNDLTEYEAVNFLLHFVQSAFEYKTDLEQFGHEKFFFPEELFHYPYSDCEDRSVLFAYLVSELLNLNVVGLDYKNHVATAVHTNHEAQGDYIIYKNQKYIVCDPTYVNAPIGCVMPEYYTEMASIIPKDEQDATYNAIQKMWAFLEEYGIYPGNYKNNATIDKKGNIYVTGFITKQTTVGQTKITPAKESKDIFIGAFDSDYNPVWMKQSAGEGNNSGLSITLNSNDDCVVTGLVEGNFNLDDTEITMDDSSAYLVCMISKEGNISWTRLIPSNEKGSANGLVYAKLSPSGTVESIDYYYDDGLFDQTGLTVDENNRIYFIENTGNKLAATKSDRSFNTGAGFTSEEILKIKRDELLLDDYEKTIAGLFAAINVVNSNGSVIEGKIIQKALDTYSPQFRFDAPVVYESLGSLLFIKNEGGIVNIRNTEGQSVSFNKMKIKDNARIKIRYYSSGNAMIEVLSGITVGKAVIWYPLNFIKLYKDTGNILFDYDDDNTQIVMNLKQDLLY